MLDPDPHKTDADTKHWLRLSIYREKHKRERDNGKADAPPTKRPSRKHRSVNSFTENGNLKDFNQIVRMTNLS
jgi:hypothetical protein